jgi:DNA-binding MarR family transcriptional regulator
MKELVEKYAELSKSLYCVCSRKELIRRKCLHLGRMECDLLHYLNTIDKPVCMNDLSVQMKVSHSRITRIIDTLVKKKFVRRFPSKRDRRSWLARITDAGREADYKTLKDFHDIQQNLINRFPKGKAADIAKCAEMYLKNYKDVLDEWKEHSDNKN